MERALFIGLIIYMLCFAWRRRRHVKRFATKVDKGNFVYVLAVAALIAALVVKAPALLGSIIIVILVNTLPASWLEGQLKKDETYEVSDLEVYIIAATEAILLYVITYRGAYFFVGLSWQLWIGSIYSLCTIWLVFLARTDKNQVTSEFMVTYKKAVANGLAFFALCFSFWLFAH